MTARASLAALVAVSLGAIPSTYADLLAANFSASGTQFASSVWSLGLDFIAKNTPTVTALGTFDYNQVGLGRSRRNAPPQGRLS